MNSVFEKQYRKRFFRCIKWAWQRATKGYCDKDLWSIDEWFLSIMPDMLEGFKKTRIGYPGELSKAFDDKLDEDTLNKLGNEMWDKILDDMIRLMKEANTIGDLDRYEYHTHCKDEALKLFSKWFYHLWD